MTIQLVNIGTANKGNGDPLRVAFDKINHNFQSISEASQGLQGIQGTRGIQGVQGTTGNGVQGIQGLQGASDQTTLTFDFGTIIPSIVVTTPIELLFYASEIDMGLIMNPSPAIYDAGILG